VRKARVLATSALVLAVVLVAALAASGCGSSSSSGSSGSTTAGGMTAAQIMAKSQQAMAKVSSASFTADVTMQLSSSGSSAGAMILGQKPIVLHAAGKVGGPSAAKVAAVDMTLQAAGQNVAVGVKAAHKKVWVEFGGKWYVAPKSTTSKAIGVPSASPSAGSSANAAAAKSLSGLGIDPQKWAKSTTVTAEKLNGVAVYHVVTMADTTKMMGDLVKALNAPGLSKLAGSGAAGLNQLKTADSAQLKTLEKSLASASVEFWVDAGTFVVRQGKVDAKLRFGSGASTQGVSGVGIGVTYTLSALNEPVKVVPPAHALPLKKLTSGLSLLAPGLSGTGSIGL
jgi:hypothetical protein